MHDIHFPPDTNYLLRIISLLIISQQQFLTLENCKLFRYLHWKFKYWVFCTNSETENDLNLGPLLYIYHKLERKLNIQKRNNFCKIYQHFSKKKKKNSKLKHYFFTFVYRTIQPLLSHKITLFNFLHTITYHTIHFVFSNHLEAYINITLNVFSAIKRADSSASKRKVSSISASDTSDHEVQEGSSPLPEESPNVFAEEKDVYESHLFDLPDDEEHLEYNMPWLGVMTKVLASFNYHCTHQNFCHPQCYRRQMRAAKRIMEATRHVRTTLY